MKRLFIFTLVLCFLSQTAFSGEGKELAVNGHMWKSFDGSMKAGWIAGFGDGLKQAMPESVKSFISSGLIKAAEKTLGDRGVGKEVDRTTASLYKKLTLSGLSYGQIIDGLDNFYKDYRNMTVLAQEAIWIVKLELRGAPQEFIDGEARLLRMPTGERWKEWSSLLKKNQAYKEASEKWLDQIPIGLHW